MSVEQPLALKRRGPLAETSPTTGIGRTRRQGSKAKPARGGVWPATSKRIGASSKMAQKLFDLKHQRHQALVKAENILQTAETEGRELTPAESSDVDICQAAIAALNPQIAAIEKKNTLVAHFRNGALIPAAGVGEGGFRGFAKPEPKRFSADYGEAFYNYIASAGKNVSAALYEGSSGAGGYAVPIMVDDQIVPLAPQEMGVRRLASVIPTVMDIKVPQKGAFGTAASKAENAAFVESDPTLSQFTLSAFMNGIQETISWELAQDVPAFQQFCVQDMVLACQMREEGFYVNGTGTGQAQGLIGNVGAGVSEEPDANGNLVSIAGTLDLTGTLNAVYHPEHPGSCPGLRPSSSGRLKPSRTCLSPSGRAWRTGLPSRLPRGILRQYAHGGPWRLPVLFGDFKRGYIIGDRGGAGINVKVLDQPAAQQGQIILLAYRRTDGRVRRSEAIQGYNVAAS